MAHSHHTHQGQTSCAIAHLSRGAMARMSVLLLVATLLCACNGRKGELRIKGEIQNLEQGDFLVYTVDGDLDHIDTLHIMQGQFDYTTPLTGDALFYVLYPNFSQQVIFASDGDVITLQGDAQNLSMLEVKGNKDNEDLTALRLQHTSPEEMKTAARQYISEHMDTRLATYLFSQYFISDKALYDSLCAAQPDSRQLLELRRQVGTSGVLEKGKKLADMTLQTRDGKKVRISDFRGQYLFITFWANWRGGASAFHYHVREYLRKDPTRYAAISYSLEMDEGMQDYVERMDSITWPSVCERNGWDGELVRKLGIHDIPYCILLDPQQRIIAHGMEYTRDIAPALK